MKYFNKDGHLNDQGIALYVDALRKNRVEQLPDEVVDHIENCLLCHQKAIDLYAIMEASGYSEADRHPSLEPQPARRIALRPYWLPAAVAAAVLLVLSVIFLTQKDLAPAAGPVIAQEDSPQNPRPPANPPASDSSQQEQPPAPKELVPPRKTTPSPQAPQLIAANFAVNDELESMVGEVYRDEGFEALSPAVGEDFAPGQPINFAWKEKTSERLYLYILNNQEKEMHKVILISNRFQLDLPLDPGLYYWKLESEEDLLYIGKFNIRPADAK
ncbi:MAG: hypothetical protein AAGG75_03825 [Bacteroidota bacterium]